MPQDKTSRDNPISARLGLSIYDQRFGLRAWPLWLMQYLGRVLASSVAAIVAGPYSQVAVHYDRRFEFFFPAPVIRSRITRPILNDTNRRFGI